MSARLSGLTIGALVLTPPFDPEVTAYTATTANAANTVTAATEDAEAEISIFCGETGVENGKPVAWTAGTNTLTVKVTNGPAEKVYTVTVTKDAG